VGENLSFALLRERERERERERKGFWFFGLSSKGESGGMYLKGRKIIILFDQE
jgi:hypothetical protein